MMDRENCSAVEASKSKTQYWDSSFRSCPRRPVRQRSPGRFLCSPVLPLQAETGGRLPHHQTRYLNPLQWNHGKCCPPPQQPTSPRLQRPLSLRIPHPCGTAFQSFPKRLPRPANIRLHQSRCHSSLPHRRSFRFPAWLPSSAVLELALEDLAGTEDSQIMLPRSDNQRQYPKHLLLLLVAVNFSSNVFFGFYLLSFLRVFTIRWPLLFEVSRNDMKFATFVPLARLLLYMIASNRGLGSGGLRLWKSSTNKPTKQPGTLFPYCFDLFSPPLYLSHHHLSSHWVACDLIYVSAF